ncbi:hypothetical protein [Shouchella clausii]|uniref:hypothetical protein n=1 Tax=Shouchella clausii TaxID=79880 RepID=UPI0026FE318F|nr:hypothetical protein [Shouchella clausii]MDO7267003.1 hypothetical protein [Shouchella clausii]MDO7286082.1 hypothetical protein [Shouchella clausii]
MKKEIFIKKSKKSERRMFLAGTTLIILGALLAVFDLNINTGTLIRLDILPLGIGLLGLWFIIVGAAVVFSRYMVKEEASPAKMEDEREIMAIKDAQAKSFIALFLMTFLCLYLLAILGVMNIISFTAFTAVILIAAFYFLYHYAKNRSV